MEISTIASTVASFLDTDEDRYPSAVREAHVNEAMMTLSREYDLDVNRAGTSFTFIQPVDVSSEWVRYPGSIAVADVFQDENLTFDTISDAWRYPFKAKDRIKAFDYRNLIDLYGDDEGAVPNAYSIFAGRLHIRPIPAIGSTFNLRMLWRGRPTYQTGAVEVPLTRAVPWGVVYRACEVACGWLLEDQRIQLFTAARQEQMTAFATTMSMSDEDTLNQMHEPTGDTGSRGSESWQD